MLVETPFKIGRLISWRTLRICSIYFSEIPIAIKLFTCSGPTFPWIVNLLLLKAYSYSFLCLCKFISKVIEAAMRSGFPRKTRFRMNSVVLENLRSALSEIVVWSTPVGWRSLRSVMGRPLGFGISKASPVEPSRIWLNSFLVSGVCKRVLRW